jgi:hypothetical protein
VGHVKNQIETGLESLCLNVSEPGDNGFFGSWYCRVAEDAFENGDAASDDDIIGYIFHDGRSFASHKGQEDGSLVQVPEEEKLTATGSR